MTEVKRSPRPRGTSFATTADTNPLLGRRWLCTVSLDGKAAAATAAGVAINLARLYTRIAPSLAVDVTSTMAFFFFVRNLRTPQLLPIAWV